jgi:hypothetical protein
VRLQNVSTFKSSDFAMTLTFLKVCRYCQQCAMFRNGKFDRLLRSGIPHSLRASIWPLQLATEKKKQAAGISYRSEHYLSYRLANNLRYSTAPYLSGRSAHCLSYRSAHYLSSRSVHFLSYRSVHYLSSRSAHCLSYTGQLPATTTKVSSLL